MPSAACGGGRSAAAELWAVMADHGINAALWNFSALTRVWIGGPVAEVKGLNFEVDER